MMEHQTGLSFITLFFETFYCELLKQKARILSGNWRQPRSTMETLPAPEKTEALEPFASNVAYQDEDVEHILKSLQCVLDEHALKASHEGGAFGVACFREAQYVSVALADEIFLHLPWEGKGYWESHLLEERLFQSHVAGDRFFQLLEAFLQERNPLKSEMTLIYLFALGLGFRGKYRGFDDDGVLSTYQHQLFNFLYQQSPSLFQTSQPLFPQAVGHTLKGSPERWNEDVRKWTLILLGLVLGYFVLSYSVWYGTTYHLDQLTKLILKDLHQLR